MSFFSFSKLIPGGNPTILLHDPELPDHSLADVAARIMHPLHLQAEQVGALYYGQAHEWSSDQPNWLLPRLEMMGGEFCVNATRSAAFCLARQGSLAQLPGRDGEALVWCGAVQVSGMAEPVRVLVSSDMERLDRAMARLDADAREWSHAVTPARAAEKPGEIPARLFCAALVSCSNVGCRQEQKGVSLVTLPGMSHLLVDADRHAPPDFGVPDWKKESAAWRMLCGLADSPASGVIWYGREGDSWRIWPAVAVRATNTEHMESACGSASLALTLMRAMLKGGDGATSGNGEMLTVIQPSGQSLGVRLHPEFASGADSRLAWISGPVSLAARGDVFL